MDFLTNPNITYLILVFGFLLAILALLSPGSGVLELSALFLLWSDCQSDLLAG